ncbi:hypothetical protein [Photobacterium sp. GB-72]|uniref:hypothetical protein n=1 Tax=Photobacterium sp. GB-72 TaxID=2022105 RepID=UPI000D17CAB4|nr:hypothetical protein [Photobacterium sp. GB-72]PSV30249.1 hypothetical protein C9J40_13275 [Photobacterium sp. GB-72]
MKHRIGLLSLVLLVGCGGGGSGSDKEAEQVTADKVEVSEPENTTCGNLPEMSCYHDPKNLTLNLHLNLIEAENGALAFNKLNAAVGMHSSSGPVLISGPDNIEIRVGGATYTPEASHSGSSALNFNNLPIEKAYEIFWYRNGDIISHTYVDDLPNGIYSFESTSDEQADTLTFKWLNLASEASNAGHINYLSCNNDNKNRELIFSLNSNYEKKMSSPYSITVKDMFGKTLTELKNEYDKCEVLFKTFTSDKSIQIVNYTNEEMITHITYNQEHTGVIFH